MRALFDNPPVRVPVLIAAVAIGLSGLTNAPVLAQVVHGLHLPATNLGYLATAQGAGSIVSGLLAGRLLARLSPAKLAALGTVLFAVGTACKAIPWWPPTIAGSATVGLGLPWPLIAGVTAVQTGTPDHLLGRVSAISGTVMFAPVALAIPLGAATVHFGPANALLFAAALALVVALVATRRQGRAQDQEPTPAEQQAA